MDFSNHYQDGVIPVEELLTNASVDLAEIVQNQGTIDHVGESQEIIEEYLDDYSPQYDVAMSSPIATFSPIMEDPSYENQSQIHNSPESENKATAATPKSLNKAVKFADETSTHTNHNSMQATPFPIRRSSRIHMRQSLETVLESPNRSKRQRSLSRSSPAKRVSRSPRATKRKSSKPLTPVRNAKRARSRSRSLSRSRTNSRSQKRSV